MCQQYTHTHKYIDIFFKYMYYLFIYAPSSFINCRLLKHLEVPFVFHVWVHSLCVPSSFPPVATLPPSLLLPPLLSFRPPSLPDPTALLLSDPFYHFLSPFPTLSLIPFFISDPVLGGVSRAPSESHPCMAERRPIPARGERNRGRERHKERG